MNFKVGDKVVRINSNILHKDMREGDEDVVVDVDGNVLGLQKFGRGHWAVMFELVEPDLETELRLCESRKGILSERIGKDQEEKKSLEKRIQELQQAIKERDKPKGRVGLKDSYNGKELWLVCASGEVKRHHPNFRTSDHIFMGNLFYDKKSAERAVHDRKQRVLRGEDV